MLKEIGYQEFDAMLRGALDEARSQREHIGELDSIVGDGDLGDAFVTALERATRVLDDGKQRDLHTLFFDIGWACSEESDSLTDQYVGMLFTGLAEGVKRDEQLDTEGLATAFEYGLASVQRQTTAEAGDKTFLDALIPAVRTLRASASAGKGPEAALDEAAVAAEKGAADTTGMVATDGELKVRSEQSQGHADAGATAVAALFRGFADALSA